MKEENNDRKPVLVLFNKNRRIMYAGKPDSFDGKTISSCLKEGGYVKTITLAAYKKLKNKWLFDD